MAVLKKSNWEAPFFGKSNDYSTGRDSLGLQTTSQASYSTLLPGLTNLTNRIRYYGFYCWLLEIYSKEIGDTNPKVQNEFVRRAEYQIALIMKLHEDEATQIPGSLFAADEITKKMSESEFDLKFGADVEKGKNTYWKYSSGAFGQYYSGALQTIGLIVHREDSPVFACTQHEDDSIVTGTVLAAAFNKNISNAVKQTFLNNIKDGVLKKADSQTLYKELSITTIPKNSTEWELYTKMLFSNDQPLFQNEDNQTFFRKDSMLSVLTYIQQDNTTENWTSFSRELYNKKGTDFLNKETESSHGWYYYQLNEYWHFGVETIFWCILETLRIEYFQVELSVFLNEFNATFKSALKKSNFIDDEAQKLNEIIDKIEETNAWELSEQIRKSIKESDASKTLFLGFKMLLSIYKQNKSEFDKLRIIAKNFGMERDGDCINGLNDFSLWLEKPIADVLEIFILKNVINRHLEIAYRKMGTGTKNTLKFSYEDNTIKHVETMSPVWTTPRIYAMYSFFKDLGYITKGNEISTVGKQLIED